MNTKQSNYPQWIALQMTNFVETDSTGTASFTSGTALDGDTEYANVFFQCVVGDNLIGYYTTSALSASHIVFYSSS